LPVISASKFEIDADEAIRTINRIQSAFNSYNSTIGNVAARSATFNSAGKDQRITLTQIDSEGRRVVSTLKLVGTGYEVVNTKVGQATAKARENAAQLERTRGLLDQIARASILGPGPPGPPSGATPAVPAITPFDPTKIAAAAGSFNLVTEAQIKAAVAANALNAAQERTLRNIVTNASTGRAAFAQLEVGIANVRSRLNEAGQIAFATAIYRSISALQLAITQGTQEAVEFSKQIGLVLTLADNGAGSFDDWAGSVRTLADEFGRPVTEVATAAYDALSNQVIRTSDDLGTLRTSVELARATNSTAAESINVISSVLNTFGASAGSAKDIADQLFVTIDLGRVRMDELNGVFGRSSSLAESVGVSFQELNAGLIVLTQQGLDSAEASTLLNNVFTQLLKPNEELAKALDRLGFANGQAAISSLGFIGTLQTLQKEAENTKDGFSTFFPEIRGARGFAGLIQNVDKFNEALGAGEKATGRLSEATRELNSVVGQQLADEANRIKNFFTADIGQSALTGVARLTSAFGGLNNIIQNTTSVLAPIGIGLASLFIATKVTDYGIVVVGLTRSFYGLSTAIDVSTASATIFGRTVTFALSPIGIGLGVAVAGFVAATFAIQKFQSSFDALNEQNNKGIERQTAGAVEAIRDEARVRVTEFQKSLDQNLSAYSRYISELRRGNNRIIEGLRESSKATETELRNSLDILLKVQRDNVGKITDIQENADQNVAQIRDSIREAEERGQQEQFERQFARIKQFQDQARAAAQAAGGNGNFFQAQSQALANLVQQQNEFLNRKLKIEIDLGNIGRAESIQREIIANFQKLESAGFVTDRAVQGQIARFKALGEARIPIEKELAEKATLQRIEEEKRLKTLEDIFSKTAQFNAKAFDNQGKLDPKFESPTEAIDGLVKLQAEAQRAIEKIGGLNDPSILKRLGLSVEEVKRQFAEQQTELTRLLTATQRDQALIKSQEQGIALEKELSKQYAESTAKLTEQSELLEQNRARALKLLEAIQATAKTPLQSANIGDSLIAAAQGTRFLDGDERSQVESLSGQLKALLNQTNVDIPIVNQRFEELRQKLNQIAALRIADPEKTGELITFATALQRAGDSLQNVGSLESLNEVSQEALENLRARGEAIGTSLRQSAENAASSIRAVTGEQTQFNAEGAGVDSVTARYSALDLQVKAVATSIARLNALSAQQPQIFKPTIPQVQFKAKGGLVGGDGGFLSDFFSGKFARGTDVVPAMLGRKEFVMPENMTQKYFTKLLRMRDGTEPIYRAEGGTVDNTTVGDIHISVNGGGGNISPEQMGRAIQRAIKQKRVKFK
jgi:TP901 family phage tail tape measure protein